MQLELLSTLLCSPLLLEALALPQPVNHVKRFLGLGGGLGGGIGISAGIGGGLFSGIGYQGGGASWLPYSYYYPSIGGYGGIGAGAYAGIGGGLYGGLGGFIKRDNVGNGKVSSQTPPPVVAAPPATFSAQKNTSDVKIDPIEELKCNHFMGYASTHAPLKECLSRDYGSVMHGETTLEKFEANHTSDFQALGRSALDVKAAGDLVAFDAQMRAQAGLSKQNMPPACSVFVAYLMTTGDREMLANLTTAYTEWVTKFVDDKNQLSQEAPIPTAGLPTKTAVTLPSSSGVASSASGLKKREAVSVSTQAAANATADPLTVVIEIVTLPNEADSVTASLDTLPDEADTVTTKFTLPLAVNGTMV